MCASINEPAAAPDAKPLPRLCQLSQLLGDFEADATASYEARANGTPRGPMTGLPKLDRELNGALSPGLHIVHGQPGAGKTAFVLQVAANAGCPALLVTCEMSPLELLRRLTANITNTYLGRLKSGELTPASAVALARRAIEAAPLLSIVDATQAYASSLYLRDIAHQLKGNASHFLLVVDSVHSWAEAAADDKGDPIRATEYDSLNTGLAKLRTLAHQLSCPVLGVAERNRESMGKEEQGSTAGTRKFEYGAETVIALQRDLKDPEDGAGDVIVKAKFAKNRNGAAGRTVVLKFNGACQRFHEDSGK
jgi:replicative DNA helicase